MSQMQVIGGRFEIGALIGEGGMGEVYHGLDTQTGQAVAIKTIRLALDASPGLVERFAREGEALRQLNHPNIVKVLATPEQAGQYYIVTEYVGGGSLRELLDAGPQLPVERTLEIGLELADALTRAHHLGIIHRDVKPANVLLAEDGTPRLTDFGLARVGESDITKTGAFVGTIAYLSPEACKGKVLDARTDIWAFGAMLFEMLAGQLPFEEDNLGAAIMAILTQSTPDLEALRPDAPVALVDLVYRMLVKDRDARIPSMRLVGAELEAIIQGADVRSSATAAAPRFATPMPTTDVPRHNLPVQTMPFIGRETELAQLVNLLADPNVRLVTVLGPGGIGKTRLALEAAAMQLEDFAQGAYFVSLAPLRDAEHIVPTMAQAVGYPFQGGKREPKGQLLDYLNEQQVLLVMDNFDHLLEGARLVSEILQATPGIKVLATTREPLNLQEEVRFRIGGLDFPDWEVLKDAIDFENHADPSDWVEYSAIHLFVLSAQRILPDFAPGASDLKDIARICQLVEGMPLAIVLAAAWVEILSVQEIANEIDQSLDLLEAEMHDVPARHRSIRTMFDSTWNRVRDAERDVLMRLSVFRGSFTRDAVQKVTAAELQTLKTLVDKSLLRRDHDTGRYELHELLRQYAETQLEASGRADAARDAHCEYYLVTLHQREAALDGRLRSAVPPVGIAQPLMDPLTKRELEVLHLIAAGLSNREIAERLFIGVSTVKKHINRMYSKLGVKRRTQAIIRARELNLL